MSSIMDLLAQTTSPQDRLMQVLSMQNMVTGARGAPGSVDPNSAGPSSGPPSTVDPNGDTSYSYHSYPMPYGGVPNDLITRFGVTLQPGPMHSLLDIARASGLMPGAQEVGQISEGYRSYAAQAAAGGTAAHPGGNNPNATTAGNSYHGQGLAIDAAWWSDHPELAQALGVAGWNRFSPSGEPWHWSYGVTG